MSLIILVIGFYIIYPLILIFINSFNVARIAEPARYGLDNWIAAFTTAGPAAVGVSGTSARP